MFTFIHVWDQIAATTAPDPGTPKEGPPVDWIARIAGALLFALLG